MKQGGNRRYNRMKYQIRNWQYSGEFSTECGKNMKNMQINKLPAFGIGNGDNNVESQFLF